MFDGLSTTEQGALVSSVGFAVLVLMGLLPRLREIGVSHALKMSLSWIAIFGVLILLISQWKQIRRAVDPASPVSIASEVRINAREDGHFYVRANVNGEPLLFLVDTGASDIVLTMSDAEDVGIDIGRLNFDGVAETANGLVRIAGVRLDTISVGEIERHAMRANVNEGELTHSLLGMRFLNSLRGWRVEGETLIMLP